LVFFARFPQCWRGFEQGCDGRHYLRSPDFGPFSVLSFRRFSVSAKDAFAPRPATARLSGCTFVTETAFARATAPKQATRSQWGERPKRRQAVAGKPPRCRTR
jgi:hypothetical protein